jgi:Trp operon repressor
MTHVVVTELSFTKNVLVEQLLVKKFYAEFHKNLVYLSLILGHEEMNGLVDRHDIHTQCLFTRHRTPTNRDVRSRTGVLIKQNLPIHVIFRPTWYGVISTVVGGIIITTNTTTITTTTIIIPQIFKHRKTYY